MIMIIIIYIQRISSKIIHINYCLFNLLGTHNYVTLVDTGMT